ncbi:MAG: response regulator transcription factor [Bacteroidales bacterium]|nr:response regulator transcription factor [Bacteroidales bacterium]
MKAFLIEDETIARERLARTLTENFPDIEIVGTAASVREAIAWLRTGRPDIIFMDVELSDGQCFEIFKKTEVHGHVVMTTAYDNYAIKAFEAGSVDYLLKPIELAALRRAVDRCRQSGMTVLDVDKLIRSLSARPENGESWKERWLVHFNDRIVPVKTADIACFYSESKDNHVVIRDGATYVVDSSLDTIATELDPAQFFRISRSCIIAKDSVESVTKLFGGRLQISLPDLLKRRGDGPDLTVSRARVDDFLAWLEN